MREKSIQELELLVDETEQLIENQGDFFTEGNKIAILDLLNHAKAVLNGAYKVPFIRNREFYKPREAEDVLFATERYTMTCSYFMKKYGLKPALAWFKSQHVMNEEKKSICEKKTFVIEKARALLLNIKDDGTVGSYGKKEVQALKKSHSCFEGLEGVDLGKAIVSVWDLIRKVRYSRILLSDMESESTMYFSEKSFEDFKKRVLKCNLLKAEYEKIKEIADKNTLEDIERSKCFMQMDIDYGEVNRYFYVWSKTDKIIHFVSPENAAFANLKFVLPSCENEEDGLGHVWIDDVKVFPTKGVDWNIKNSGFETGLEQPEYWKPVVLKGDPIFKWEDKKPFCGLENRSIYIENPTKDDKGAWEYGEDIPIDGGVNNTITFLAKLDGKLKEGLEIVITFKDKDGRGIEEFVNHFNRKSCLATGDYNLTIQADAIVYAFTGDITYARKVRQQMLFILNDFCQGIEHWLVTNSRPQGNDAYGAVQGGRILCSIMSAYTFVKDSEAFSKEDMDSIIPQLEYFVRYLMDLRDRTELGEYDVQMDSSNWQTDMAAGTGMLMMAIPEFPNARQWLENANMFLRNQLRFKVNKDGSWPESLRYHFAALSRFLVYAKVLINCIGENWFSDGPLLNMFRYAVMVQTPPYDFFDNKIATVNFGDHVLDGGGSFYLAGIYCNDIAALDEELSTQMYETWVKSGRQVSRYWGESIAIENLFSSGESFSYNEGSQLNLKSCGEFRDSGIYLFRKDFGKASESLFAIMASPHKIGHGHYDEGSFIIFKDCKPIVVELGIEGYFDSTKDWYISSSSHSVVQFSRKEGKAAPQPFTINLETSDYSAQAGWVDTPRACEVLDYSSAEELDSISVKIINSEGEGYHIRKVDFHRNAEVYVIYDKIFEFDRKVRFSLNVAATKSEIKENCVLSKGHFGVDLETVFLGKTPEISIEWGRTKPMFPTVEGENVVNIIRAEISGKDGFLTVLYPKQREEGKLHIAGEDGKYIITTPEGKTVVLDNVR